MHFYPHDYKAWLHALTLKVCSIQLKTSTAVNETLIAFYWELGKVLSEKDTVWGRRLIEKITRDLKHEFPHVRGLSRRNLFNAKKFYKFYNPSEKSSQLTVTLIFQEMVKRIPWGHNIQIFTKSQTTEEALFYMEQTITGHWSREMLALQIRSGLYQRQGKSVNNFKNTLPDSISDLAQQTLKDPYIFDFMTMESSFGEKDIEQGLIEHVSKFLLELGKGFAFIGRQYHLEIADHDYYLDLLFYHTQLKCYVVIELKNTRFMPEYTGKLNFYLSAVDTLLKQDDDHSTIGIILCRDKNDFEAQSALHGINKPMSISEFEIIESLRDDLDNDLSAITEKENELALRSL